MTQSQDECFVIMPISDPDGYEKGHFRHVYEDIVSKACDIAGFRPLRADDVLETNLIHLDVLKRIIDTPMAVCDLSTRNPNVLFELGLRQAFDKPVVLIQEKGTPAIFDIAPLRYTEYRKERVYHQVLEDQERIANALKATKQATDEGSGLNSMVKLLSLTSSAQLKDIRGEGDNPIMQLLLAQMEGLRREVRESRVTTQRRDAIKGDEFNELRRLRYILLDAERALASSQGDREGLLSVFRLLDECVDRARHLWQAVSSHELPPSYKVEFEDVYDGIMTLRGRTSKYLAECEEEVES